MDMQLILAAFLVSVGFISTQPKDQMSVKAPISDKHDEIKIEGSFWKLFDSLTQNDVRKTETYRKFLGQQSVKEQHAFDRMKDELWFARRKHSERQGNLYHKNGNINVATAFKRDTRKNKTEDPKNPRRNMKWVEREFARHLLPGRGYHDSYLALWSRDKQEALCIRSMNNTFQFHGGKTVDVVPLTIKFRWEKHEPIRVDALKCPARNRFIYESRRERDCYMLLANDEYRKDPPDEVYPFYEICNLGRNPTPFPKKGPNCLWAVEDNLVIYRLSVLDCVSRHPILTGRRRELQRMYPSLSTLLRNFVDLC